MEEEEGGQMAAAAVYPNVHVIQSCSLWKTPVVVQNKTNKQTTFLHR
jgi:hypothetical protein